MTENKDTSLFNIRKRIFKRNRLAWYSLHLFIFMFGLSLMAELIANDKPIIIQYDNHYYFPVLKDYPETTFGGVFETNADYKDPYVQNKIDEKGWCLWPMVRYSYLTLNKDKSGEFPSPPTRENWLGTDVEGRDVFAKILYGFRLSVVFGLLLSSATIILGILIGAIMGYYGGKIDLLGQRIIEIWGGFPVSYFIMILSSFVIPSFFTLLAIMLLFSWIGQASLVRYEFLQTRKQPYVLAAHALGVPNYQIIFKHILPNALVSTISFLPFMLAGSITTLTSLDFLGFGLPMDAPALGEILVQGKNNLYATWIGLSGFGILAIVLILLLFIGEGVRDAFDPHMNFEKDNTEDQS